MKITHEKNFWGGALFIAIGLMFAVVARGVKFGDTVLLNGYTMGTPARMGPGFFPFYLGIMLILLGAFVLVTGLRAQPGGDGGKLERFHWKPILFVLGSVVLFGLLLKPIGMLLAGVLLVIGASLGSYEFKLKNTVILGVILSIFCALVFVTGLKLPIPLCPDIESLQSTIGFCRA
jgi:hypothetical protein